MSDTTVQPLSRREQKRAERAQRKTDKAERKDTKRAARQGRKMLKAGYALAAAERKRIDPAVREQIGRAKLGRAELQALAHSAVNAEFQPDRYGNHAQRLSQVANARLRRAGPAPRNNFITRHNRYSRWRRNERAGTKALKQAFTQAARDVKKTDPAVLAAIGRSRFTSLDLASLSSGQVGRVFDGQGQAPGRGQGQNGPGQQPQGAGRAQQPQAGIQSRDAAQRGPAPQSEQMNQRIIALQQSIIENQQRTIALLEQNNQLQAQMQQLLQERAAQVQQQNQLTNPSQDLGQQGQQQGQPGQQQGQPGQQQGEPDQQQGQSGQQQGEPGQQQGGAQQPAPQLDDHVRFMPVLDDGQGQQAGEETGTAAPAPEPAAQAPGEQGQEGEAVVEGGEGGEPRAVGEQGGEQGLSGNEAAVQGGPEQAPAQAEVSEGERWTQSIENGNPYANGPQGTGNQQQPAMPGPQSQQTPTGPQTPGPNGQQPAPGPQTPGPNGQQAASSTQTPGPAGQQAQQGGEVQGEGQGAAADPQLAELRRVSMGAQTPLGKVSGDDVKKATQESQGDTSRPQHGNQGPTKSTQSKPSGKQI
ncbi:hypothetical protein [Kribbella sp. NPDC048928]|uniref:hypothetical protein n=1 Tax=Kribbella sp. NPDC048928 TaxID=3364111 RepID=UPI0037199E44